MSFTATKRKFLVDMLGETRVREIEEQLPVLAKTLREYGVAYKDLSETIGRATSFAEADALREISNKLDAFSGIVFNITAGDMAPDAKRAAVQQAATDLATRLGSAPKAGAKGRKAFHHETLSPAAAYANDLLSDPPAEQTAKAVKGLRAGGHSAGQYLADLFERGRAVVQS